MIGSKLNELSFLKKKLEMSPKKPKKRQKSPKNDENEKKIFFFESHSYFASFYPKMILYTSLVQKVVYLGGVLP